MGEEQTVTAADLRRAQRRRLVLPRLRDASRLTDADLAAGTAGTLVRQVWPGWEVLAEPGTTRQGWFVLRHDRWWAVLRHPAAAPRRRGSADVDARWQGVGVAERRRLFMRAMAHLQAEPDLTVLVSVLAERARGDIGSTEAGALATLLALDDPDAAAVRLLVALGGFDPPGNTLLTRILARG